jgi:hypothetical protein
LHKNASAPNNLSLIKDDDKLFSESLVKQFDELSRTVNEQLATRIRFSNFLLLFLFAAVLCISVYYEEKLIAISNYLLIILCCIAIVALSYFICLRSKIANLAEAAQAINLQLNKRLETEYALLSNENKTDPIQVSPYCDISRLDVDLSSEMFRDALFFREKATLIPSTECFIRWRYVRASIIYFCCALESWVNSTLTKKLQEKQKVQILPRFEHDLLNFLLNEDFYEPHNPVIKLNIPTKLRKTLPQVLSLQEIDDKIINQYLELVKLRNRIIHFSSKDLEAVYESETLYLMLHSAPEIIEKLITMFEPANVPDWVKARTVKGMD